MVKKETNKARMIREAKDFPSKAGNSNLKAVGEKPVINIQEVTDKAREEIKPKIEADEKKSDVDTVLIDDIELTVANDEQFYRQTHIPFVKNYRKKIKRGVFNTELGIKGMVNNAVPRAVKRYNEITQPEKSDSPQYKLNKDEKSLLGKQLLDRVLNDIDEGVE